VIWLALVALICVVGGSWFVATSMKTRAIVLVTGLVAVGGYVLIGHPDMPDEPLAGRLDELEKLVQTPDAIEALTPDQIMAIFQKRGLEHPKDPIPHAGQAKLLEIMGRPQEAVMAYQAALRRDPDFLPAITGLADLLFKSSGDVDLATGQLYERAHELDPRDPRITFMAGVGALKAGREDDAERLWAEAEAATPKDDPKQGMYKALRQMFTAPPAAPGEPPAIPSETPPG
jgi:cytochrome c-type biogenesis protein CcmH/NrfG